MKWLMILALVAACTTKQTTDTTTPEETTSTESESKPISPHTIEACFCNKIFQPVCADGVNYGNSCEAECHGHKTWTEGNCATPKKK